MRFMLYVNVQNMNKYEEVMYHLHVIDQYVGVVE